MARWERYLEWVILRHRVGLLRTLEKSLQQFFGSSRAIASSLESIGACSEAVLEQYWIKFKELKRLQASEEKSLRRDFQLLMNNSRQAYFASIPGVSPFGAGLMDLMLSDDVPSCKSWIAFVGLDVSVRESGTWRGRCSLTRRGDSYLRKRLYQMAWGAKQTDAAFGAYYTRLRATGRSYVESLLIIARKILRIAYALSKQNRFYDSSMLKTA